MADFRRKKNVLRQLVKARDAVKRKYNLLRFGREKFDRAMEETFKPVVDPLKKIVDLTSKRVAPSPPPPPSDEEESLDDYNSNDEESSVKSDSSASTTSTTSSLNATIRAAKDFETTDEDDNEYIAIVDGNQSDLLDKVYGVRREGNSYMLGNLPIHFGETIKIDNVSYPKTEGLLELLVKKNPDRVSITPRDLKIYQKILEQTSAHKRRYRSDELIRAHNSKKYVNYIAPMFQERKGGSLPRYKRARRGTRMDYVYWDDPNELVDRLRLLVAERDAGNQSHTNEIVSIIEELREAGYIY